MRALALAVLAALALVATGCGGSNEPKTTTVPTATAQATTASSAPAVRAFRQHAAAAVAALRAGIEQPYRDGAFSTSDPVKLIAALANAGTAASTAVTELTAAVKVATSDGGIPELAAQAQSLLSAIPGLIASAKDGQIDTQTLSTFLDDLDALGRSASAAGIDVPGSTTATTPG